MYIKRNPSYGAFPLGYNGNLSSRDITIENEATKTDNTENNNDICKDKKYKFKKTGVSPLNHDENKKNDGDESLLLGLLLFLYVGCEHTSENLILMGIIAYLLFADGKALF